jgi:hypothetical protein
MGEARTEPRRRRRHCRGRDVVERTARRNHVVTPYPVMAGHDDKIEPAGWNLGILDLDREGTTT